MSQDKHSGSVDKVEYNEVVTKLYESLLKEIREIEKNFLSLSIPLITSIGLYGFGFREFIYQPKFETAIVFSLTTFASVLICFIICFGATIFAYTHRSNQLVLSTLEKKYKELQEVIPKNWDLRDKFKKCGGIDPPEIYKFFRILSMAVSICSIIVYFITLLSHSPACTEKSPNKEIYTILPLITILVIFLILLILICKFSWSTYEQKLKRLYAFFIFCTLTCKVVF